MIYLGSDHAGYALKQAIAHHLEATGKAFKDLGNIVLDPDDDYPDFAFAVGEAVGKTAGARGILICGSSQGVCMAANKVKGVRAATAAFPKEAVKTREHNDANVLCLAGWNLSQEAAAAIVDAFLSTPFSREARHVRRLEKISAYENHG